MLQGSIILNGRRPLQEAPRVRKIARAFRVDNGLRGPAAGRAQQEARAAAAAAAAQQQLRSEADVRALMEVCLPPLSGSDKLSLFNICCCAYWPSHSTLRVACLRTRSLP